MHCLLKWIGCQIKDGRWQTGDQYSITTQVDHRHSLLYLPQRLKPTRVLELVLSIVWSFCFVSQLPRQLEKLSADHENNAVDLCSGGAQTELLCFPQFLKQVQGYNLWLGQFDSCHIPYNSFLLYHCNIHCPYGFSNHCQVFIIRVVVPE